MSSFFPELPTLPKGELLGEGRDEFTINTEPKKLSKIKEQIAQDIEKYKWGPYEFLHLGRRCLLQRGTFENWRGYVLLTEEDLQSFNDNNPEDNVNTLGELAEYFDAGIENFPRGITSLTYGHTDLPGVGFDTYDQGNDIIIDAITDISAYRVILEPRIYSEKATYKDFNHCKRLVEKLAVAVNLYIYSSRKPCQLKRKSALEAKRRIPLRC